MELLRKYLLISLTCVSFCYGFKTNLVCEQPGAHYFPMSLLETCDFFYKSKCYFLLMEAARVNRPEAEAACTRKGGRLANIYSEEHFAKALSLIRTRTLGTFHYNHIWTGMNVDIEQRKIRLRDGEWAPYQKWCPQRPFTPARIAVGIHAEWETRSTNFGMFDEHVTYKLLGGLCEKNID